MERSTPSSGGGEEAFYPVFVQRWINVPALGVTGLRHGVVRDPPGQLGGEVFAGSDRYHLVVFAVEEEDRQLEVLAMLQGVEAVPVDVDTRVDCPLDRQRRKGREPHPGRVEFEDRFPVE